MANILHLVDDITALMEGGGKGGSVSPSFSDFYENIGKSYVKQVFPVDRERKPNALYFSEVGESCGRKLWYKHHARTSGEQLPAHTRIKFLYGDMLEELVLQLARDAGHEVSDEQREVVYDIGNGWCVRGRIDAVVDGCVVDVKSVTKYSEKKFHDGLKDDPFNYRGQLTGYAVALKNENSGFITIQKELGHINYFPQPKPSATWWQTLCENAVKTVTGDLPDRTIAAVQQSATSKNLKLDTKCSYCEFKKECWKDANANQGLRTFLYSNGPVHLVNVVDVPKVPEVEDAEEE